MIRKMLEIGRARHRSRDQVAVQKWPTHLVIVRHGQSERNARGQAAKLNGQASFHQGLRDADTRLTAWGQKQALLTGEFLAKRYRFDAAFSSPYLRARQTADAILDAYDQAPRVLLEERVREIEFGILDGLTWDGVKVRYPEEYARCEREGKYWYRPPGGENRPDVALRVKDFLGTLARDYRQKSVLVVCHSVVVLIFRRLLERWDEAQYLEIDAKDDVLNCAVTAYRYDHSAGKLKLEMYNSVCYSNADRGNNSYARAS